MLRARSLRAKSPLSREVKRLGRMKPLSVVGRNWWTWMVLAASRSCFGGRARRRASFSFADSVDGMCSAAISWSNWSCVSAGLFG